MREAILSVLLLGRQYGLQIRGEIFTRTNGFLNLNSGQVYQTLERLMRDGLVEAKAKTKDGLPLYSLTSKGNEVALAWVATPAAKTSKNSWDVMIAQIMLVRTIPNIDFFQLINKYLEFWQNYSLQTTKNDYCVDGILDDAEKQIKSAAINWLKQVQQTQHSPVPLSKDRPARGRPKL